jgi:hypothetical protein
MDIIQLAVVKFLSWGDQVANYSSLREIFVSSWNVGWNYSHLYNRMFLYNYSHLYNRMFLYSYIIYNFTLVCGILHEVWVPWTNCWFHFTTFKFCLPEKKCLCVLGNAGALRSGGGGLLVRVSVRAWMPCTCFLWPWSPAFCCISRRSEVVSHIFKIVFEIQ